MARASSIRLAATMVLAGCMASSVYFHWHDPDHFHPFKTAVVLVALMTLLAALIWAPLGWAVRQPSMQGNRLPLTIAGSLLIGWALTYAIPMPIAPNVNLLDVTITATGERSSAALGSEVWFRLEVDGQAIPVSDVRTVGPWRQNENMLVSTEAASATWTGRVRHTAQVVMVAHPWSGHALVTVDGESQAFDLYRAKDATASIVAPLTGKAYPWLNLPNRSLLQRWVHISDAVTLSLMLMLFVLAASANVPAANPARERRLWIDVLVYSTPMLIGWWSLLLIYIPGLMTPDSVDQWHQAGSGQFNDWHPPYHAMLIALIRKAWDSPAAVAVIQAGALALASGWLIAAVRKTTSAPPWSAYFASLLVTLCPFLAFTSITLWKDVPYSATVVAVTAALVTIVLLKRLDLKRWHVFVLAIMTLLACMLLRHNGTPVVAASLVLAWGLAREQRKAVLALGGITLALFIVLRGPVADAFGVKRSNVQFAVFSHHIAAHLTAGEDIDEKELALLDALGKGHTPWHYSCATVDRTIFSPDFDAPSAAAHSNELKAIWFKLAASAPGTELAHVACSSALVWRMTQTEADPLYHSTIALYVDKGRVAWLPQDGPMADDLRRQGVEARSVFPEAAERLGRFVTTDLDYDLLWRPAGYLFIFLMALQIAVQRTGERRLLIVAVPILSHSAFLVIGGIAQDVRYQMAAIAIAVAATPCLLASRRRASSLTRET